MKLKRKSTKATPSTDKPKSRIVKPSTPKDTTSKKSAGGSVGLGRLLSTLKSDGYIVKKLDQHLLSLNAKDEDRRYDINSPSSAGRCPRSIVYSRLGYTTDSNSIDARTRRIFDNGTGVHERLQKYMLECNILEMDEVPVFHLDYQIQGHTDGLLRLLQSELGILEIKSINSNGFSKLVDAKPEHKLQASVYMYCLEKRRLWLRGNYKTEDDIDNYLVSKEYIQFVHSLYTHMKGGSHYSLEDKLKFKLDCHMNSDKLLWGTSKPINKMVFLYENKDTQDLKEFTVTWDEEMIEEQLNQYESINTYVADKKLPPRPKEATSKNCGVCRWCNYTSECWVI